MTMKIMGIVVYNVAWAKTYLRTKWQLDPSSRLATVDIIDMGRKVRVLCPIFKGGLGCDLTQCLLGRGLPLYQVVS